jgi:hypothetical protein
MVRYSKKQRIVTINESIGLLRKDINEVIQGLRQYEPTSELFKLYPGETGASAVLIDIRRGEEEGSVLWYSMSHHPELRVT